MQIKLHKVMKLNDVLKNIINNKDYKLDVVTKFQMLGILKEFEAPLMNIETIRNEKIIEYGKTNEEGNVFIDQTDTENMGKFIADMNALMNSDVELDINPLDAKTVSDIGLSADELMTLYDIMELN